MRQEQAHFFSITYDGTDVPHQNPIQKMCTVTLHIAGGQRRAIYFRAGENVDKNGRVIAGHITDAIESVCGEPYGALETRCDAIAVDGVS